MKSDNPFASKLYHHTIPVREEVWTSVEKRLPPNEGKRFPFFWFLLFISSLMGGALMFGLIHKDTPAPVIPTAPIPSHTLNTHDQPTGAEVTGTSEDGIPEDALATNQVNAQAAGLPAFSSSTKSKVGATKSGSGRHPDKSSGNYSTAHPPALLPEADATWASASSGRYSAAHTTNSTSFIPMADLDALIKPGVDVIGIRKNKPDPNCYRFSGMTGRYLLSVDGFAGPGFSPRTFTTSDGESSSYTQAREATEENQYAWSAGARFNLQMRNGLTFRLGLLYDQAGDVFDYTDTLATHSTFRIDSFFAADGTFLYSDSSRVLIFGTLIKRIHNTYRHLDVPILVSYEMPLGRSSSLMLNAGPVFNLTASYEGQILDPMLHPRTITPGSQNELYAYKTSLGISLYFGAGLVFPLSDNISGVVEPRYLYRIKPVTVQSYPLEEHRHFAGLNLGLRYYFD